jgi:hypothetical protein
VLRTSASAGHRRDVPGLPKKEPAWLRGARRATSTKSPSSATPQPTAEHRPIRWSPSPLLAAAASIQARIACPACRWPVSTVPKPVFGPSPDLLRRERFWPGHFSAHAHSRDINAFSLTTSGCAAQPVAVRHGSARAAFRLRWSAHARSALTTTNCRFLPASQPSGRCRLWVVQHSTPAPGNFVGNNRLAGAAGEHNHFRRRSRRAMAHCRFEAPFS